MRSMDASSYTDTVSRDMLSISSNLIGWHQTIRTTSVIKSTALEDNQVQCLVSQLLLFIITSYLRRSAMLERQEHICSGTQQ
jgi:hypothetical protein